MRNSVLPYLQKYESITKFKHISRSYLIDRRLVIKPLGLSLYILLVYCVSMVLCKTAVSPLLMHWRYYSLALIHRYFPNSAMMEWLVLRQSNYPDSKVHVANVGPTWVLSGPDGPHVGPMNLAIMLVSLFRVSVTLVVCMSGTCFVSQYRF